MLANVQLWLDFQRWFISSDFDEVQRNLASIAAEGSFWDIPMFYLEGDNVY